MYFGCAGARVFAVATAETDFRRDECPHPAPTPEALQSLVNQTAQATLSEFASNNLGPEELAVTLVDLTFPSHSVQASYRGDAAIYPASIVKLFYLVAAHRWLEDGRLADTPELRRALRDMIVDSYNEATGYVVDLLTGTTSGPELSAAEISSWHDQRGVVNRYFASLGYRGINVNKKTWCEGPYGRDKQVTQLFQPARNFLTTNASARLLTEIVTGRAVTRARSAQMMELLKRDYSGPGNLNDQAHGYTGTALPPGTRLWSKAGWTSETRHDAAYVELPNGAKFVLVTFTVDQANERQIIPDVAKSVMEGISAP